ncbi:MAG TPA: CBS domain-containing protein [Burkholderiales bacterium]|nr:CBS domain-containing protein [Burkholderiales bacterium]
MIIRDILNLKGSTIFSIAPQGLVADAVAIMVKHDIGSLVVMEGGAMKGMVTFREVLRALDARHGNLGALPVSEVMVRDPLVCVLEDSADSLRERMTQQHVRYVPVQEGGNLLGVISFHDIAKAAIKEASFENRLLKRYIKNWPEEGG